MDVILGEMTVCDWRWAAIGEATAAAQKKGNVAEGAVHYPI